MEYMKKPNIEPRGGTWEILTCWLGLRIEENIFKNLGRFLLPSYLSQN